MTAKQVMEYIMEHQTSEFVDHSAVYYIHINADGEIVDGTSDWTERYTAEVDITEWENDDSPERFYEEYENPQNTAFVVMCEKLAAEINGAANWTRDGELFDWEQDKELWGDIVSYMDDDIREDLHIHMAPCTNKEFVEAYIARDDNLLDILRNEFGIEME